MPRGRKRGWRGIPRDNPKDGVSSRGGQPASPAPAEFTNSMPMPGQPVQDQPPIDPPSGAESSASTPASISRKPSMPLQVNLRGRKHSIDEPLPVGEPTAPSPMQEGNDSGFINNGDQVSNGEIIYLNSEIKEDRPIKRPRLGEVSEENPVLTSNAAPQMEAQPAFFVPQPSTEVSQPSTDVSIIEVPPPVRVVNRGGRPRGRGRGGRRPGAGRAKAVPIVGPVNSVPGPEAGPSAAPTAMPTGERPRGRGGRPRGRGRGRGRGAANIPVKSVTISQPNSSDASEESGNESTDYLGRRRSTRVKELNIQLQALNAIKAGGAAKKPPPKELVTAMRSIELVCTKIAEPLTTEQIKERKENLEAYYKATAKVLTACNAYRVRKTVKQLIKVAGEEVSDESPEWAAQIAADLVDILDLKLKALEREDQAVNRARKHLEEAEMKWILRSNNGLYEEIAELMMKKAIRQNVPIPQLVKIVKARDPYIERVILRRTRVEKLEALTRSVLIATYEDTRGRNKSKFDQPQIVSRSNQGLYDRHVLETWTARARRISAYILENEGFDNGTTMKVHVRPGRDITRNTKTLKFVKDYEFSEENPAHVLPPKFHTISDKEASEALAILKSGQVPLNQSGIGSLRKQDLSSDTHVQAEGWVEEALRDYTPDGVHLDFSQSMIDRASPAAKGKSIDDHKDTSFNMSVIETDSSELTDIEDLTSTASPPPQRTVRNEPFVDNTDNREDESVDSEEDYEVILPLSPEKRKALLGDGFLTEERDKREASTRPIGADEFEFITTNSDDGHSVAKRRKINVETAKIDERGEQNGTTINVSHYISGNDDILNAPHAVSSEVSAPTSSNKGTAKLNESAMASELNKGIVMDDGENHDVEDDELQPGRENGFDLMKLQRRVEGGMPMANAPSDGSAERSNTMAPSYTEFGSGPGQVPGILVQASATLVNPPLPLPQKILPSTTSLAPKSNGYGNDRFKFQHMSPVTATTDAPRRPRGRPRKDPKMLAKRIPRSRRKTNAAAPVSNILPANPANPPYQQAQPPNQWGGPGPAPSGSSYVFPQRTPGIITTQLGASYSKDPSKQSGTPPAPAGNQPYGMHNMLPETLQSFPPTTSESNTTGYKISAQPLPAPLPPHSLAPLPSPDPSYSRPAERTPVPGPAPPYSSPSKHTPSQHGYQRLQPAGPTYTLPNQPFASPQHAKTAQKANQTEIPKTSYSLPSTPANNSQPQVKYYVGNGVFRTAPSPSSSYHTSPSAATYGSVFREDGYSKDLNELAKNGTWKNKPKKDEQK
ncbi:hypothetical protein RUND412_008257 [Rhizina undulata]